MKAKLCSCLGLFAVVSLLLTPAGAVAGGPGRQEAEQARKGSRSVTQAVSDGWITMKIHAQFVDEDPLEDSDIDVDTNNGIVTLNGTVASEAGRARAVAIAKATDGVKNVVDRLRIARADEARGTTGEAAGKAVRDGWIKSKIYSQFLEEDPLDKSDIDIDVDKGSVTLKGSVPNTDARTRAEEIARKTDGVKVVKNDLIVGPGVKR